MVKNLPANAGDIRDAGLIPGSGRFPLEKKMTTHSSILAWRISGTEEPCGLQSIIRSRTWLKWLSTWSVIKTASKIHGICPVLSLRNNLESFKIIQFFDTVVLSANCFKNDLIFWKSDMMKTICGMRLVVQRQGKSVIRLCDCFTDLHVASGKPLNAFQDSFSISLYMYMFLNVLICCMLDTETYITCNHILNSNNYKKNEYLGIIYFKKRNLTNSFEASVPLWMHVCLIQNEPLTPLSFVLNKLFTFS